MRRDRRFGLEVGDGVGNGIVAVIVQLFLESVVDEVVQSPKLTQPHIGAGIHQIASDRDANLPVRVVVPGLQVAGECFQTCDVARGDRVERRVRGTVIGQLRFRVRLDPIETTEAMVGANLTEALWSPSSDTNPVA
jgi:hypothetical protein